jgi:hypothetical protein
VLLALGSHALGSHFASCTRTECPCLSFHAQVYDRDSPQDKLTDHDFIGSCADVRLVDILQAEGKVLNLALHRTLEKKSYGTLQVSADAVIVRAPNPPVCLQVALDSKVRAKFFFTLTRQMPHGGYHPVYRSELLEKSDCHFSPLTLKVSTLCAGQPTRNLRLELYQFFPMGRSKAVGFSPFSLGGLQRKSASDTLSWTKAKNGDACNVLLDRSEDPATASTTCKVTITRCCP